MKKLFTVLAAILVCVTSVFTSCNKDPQSDDTPKKALLIILDGWGIGDQSQSDVIAQTAKTMGYETIITADHGNADHAINADGTPNTAHSTNPVPFIYVTENKNATVQNGALADVAPTILHIMGLGQPQEMTGQCLISE